MTFVALLGDTVAEVVGDAGGTSEAVAKNGAGRTGSGDCGGEGTSVIFVGEAGDIGSTGRTSPKVVCDEETGEGSGRGSSVTLLSDGTAVDGGAETEVVDCVEAG